jgi:hypothetical protein
VARHIATRRSRRTGCAFGEQSFRGPRPQGTSQKGFLDLPFDPVAATIKPDYEWQYHYAGPHVRWGAHWARVMGQFKPLPPTVASKTTVPAAQ